MPKEPSFETTWVAGILVVCGLPFIAWLLLAEPSVNDNYPCEPFFGEVEDDGRPYDEPRGCGVERDRRLAGVALVTPLTLLSAQVVVRKIASAASSRQPMGAGRIIAEQQSGMPAGAAPDTSGSTAGGETGGSDAAGGGPQMPTDST